MGNSDSPFPRIHCYTIGSRNGLEGVDIGVPQTRYPQKEIVVLEEKPISLTEKYLKANIWGSEFHSGSAGIDNEAISSCERRVLNDLMNMILFDKFRF